ncbi:MAG TPA: acyltransferase [Flavobacteriales bacterium]
MPPATETGTSGDRERIFGLDVMRAMAIVLVVLVHSAPFLRGTSPGWIAGIDGVDLFFVLSGFLIGGLLLKEPPTKAGHRGLLDFWQRRWLRTLPNYFVFLGLNVLLVRSGIAPGILSSATWAYAVFLQNLHFPLDLFFWESWSLSVEEWFYLLFPMLLYLAVLGARLPFQRVFPLLALVFCVIAFGVRMYWLQRIGTAEDLEIFVRKLVLTRWDAIAIGALAAWVSVRWAGSWKALRWPALGSGVVLLLMITAYRPQLHAPLWTACYFTLMPLSMTLLLPLLSGWRAASTWTKPVVFLSRSAYALYLVHLPVLYVLLHFGFSTSGPLNALLYWSLCLLLATIVWYAVESPFLRLREGIGRRIRKVA